MDEVLVQQVSMMADGTSVHTIANVTAGYRSACEEYDRFGDEESALMAAACEQELRALLCAGRCNRLMNFS